MNSIEELLNSMQTRYKSGTSGDSIKNLQNTRDTWERIGAKDSFEELGFSSQDEKENFLAEWIKDNPYNNI